ncbi:uncharacterized protein EAE97_006990 [Botrytis byssoidea]|uniref:O-methyltransferase domain-containing protein n=1 Tax=Botrytis byssoidea TaxID=139641 RepID=A0A9P5INU0_9HELO|nr:uncharacterized protein EAE97_006990 [Botrytis byssoidea]KAF7940804.1 hypothetical protein EAE97_006990 [Botrytis byssoidea]
MPPPQGRRTSFTPHPGWSAVDEYTMSKLHSSQKPNHGTLAHALRNCSEKGLPSISSSPAQGKFLALQVKSMRVKHVLEVGTLGGYASIWIATENPDCKTTTLEFDPRHAKVARENIEHAGVSDRVEVLEGSAVDILPGLLKEIEEGKRERFGLTFVDADKLNNWTYFDFGVKMSYSGAAVFLDNMACRGDLVREDRFDDPHVEGARTAIENAGKDERVDCVVMQIVSEKNWDGFLMAVVN